MDIIQPILKLQLIVDINDTYRMMMTMMMIMMMKTQNGHNLANFETTTPRFCMVIDLNDTYRMIMMFMKIIMRMMKIKR